MTQITKTKIVLHAPHELCEQIIQQLGDIADVSVNANVPATEVDYIIHVISPASASTMHDISALFCDITRHIEKVVCLFLRYDTYDGYIHQNNAYERTLANIRQVCPLTFTDLFRMVQYFKPQQSFISRLDEALPLGDIQALLHNQNMRFVEGTTSRITFKDNFLKQKSAYLKDFTVISIVESMIKLNSL